nr:hypothetical protein Itr_chr02CG14020 [Ipomoea trifida]
MRTTRESPAADRRGRDPHFANADIYRIRNSHFANADLSRVRQRLTGGGWYTRIIRDPHMRNADLSDSHVRIIRETHFPIAIYHSDSRSNSEL